MRTLIFIVLFSVLGPHAAAAHGADEHEPYLAWTFDPWIVGPLAVSGLMYLAGMNRLCRGTGYRGIRFWHAMAYGAGWLSLGIALMSPLHWLGEHVFTFHMIEHEIVMAVAAPLIVLARPIGALLWGLPKAVRRRVVVTFQKRNLRRLWSFVSGGRNATIIHGLAIWAWHAPILFDAAVTNVAIHRLQHVSFFSTALLFWWAVLRRSDYGAGAFHLFVTMLHTSALGALMALAPHVIYGEQTLHSAEWGLTRLEDQQLAGVVMWVPAGTVYAGAALALIARWISRSSKRSVPYNAI
jgi:putative membrane protein